MIVEETYQLLMALYNFDPKLKISDYLIDEQKSIAATKINHAGLQDEVFYIQQNGSEFDLGLYLNPDFIEILDNTKHPQRHVNKFSCVVEGISHFLTFCHRAQNGKSISALELELQAEVDKFLLLHLYALKNEHEASPEFFDWQFDDVFYVENLSEELKDRYRSANQLAAHFCNRLRKKCFYPRNMHELLKEIRPFFHANLSEKVSMILS